MRYVEADGLRTSVIGLGAWQFGSREWGYGEAYAGRDRPALVRRAIELGITMLDTAEAYGPGRSERIIAGALAAVAMAGTGRASSSPRSSCRSRPAEPILARQAAGSRRRLEVDALDLYYAHWPNPFVSVRRTMQALRPLVDAGLVRRVGVSNYGVDRGARPSGRCGRRSSPTRSGSACVSPGRPRDLVPYAAARAGSSLPTRR